MVFFFFDFLCKLGSLHWSHVYGKESFLMATFILWKCGSLGICCWSHQINVKYAEGRDHIYLFISLEQAMLNTQQKLNKNFQ